MDFLPSIFLILFSSIHIQAYDILKDWKTPDCQPELAENISPGPKVRFYEIVDRTLEPENVNKTLFLMKAMACEIRVKDRFERQSIIFSSNVKGHSICDRFEKTFRNVSLEPNMHHRFIIPYDSARESCSLVDTFRSMYGKLPFRENIFMDGIKIGKLTDEPYFILFVEWEHINSTVQKLRESQNFRHISEYGSLAEGIAVWAFTAMEENQRSDLFDEAASILSPLSPSTVESLENSQTNSSTITLAASELNKTILINFDKTEDVVQLIYNKRHYNLSYNGESYIVINSKSKFEIIENEKFLLDNALSSYSFLNKTDFGEFQNFTSIFVQSDKNKEDIRLIVIEKIDPELLLVSKDKANIIIEQLILILIAVLLVLLFLTVILYCLYKNYHRRQYKIIDDGLPLVNDVNAAHVPLIGNASMPMGSENNEITNDTREDRTSTAENRIFQSSQASLNSEPDPYSPITNITVDLQYEDLRVSPPTSPDLLASKRVVEYNVSHLQSLKAFE